MTMQTTTSAAPGCAIIVLDLQIADQLSDSLIQQINEGCDRADDAGPNCALLIRFSAGRADRPTAAEAGASGVHLVNRWERALCRIEGLAGVTISVAQGACNALVFAVMLSTDYRIVDARFNVSLVGRFDEIMPGMILHRLVQQIGVSRARPLVLFGRQLNAVDALALGLVGEIAADVETAANAFHASLTPAAGLDMAVRRRLLLDAATTSFDEGLGSHLAACDRTLRQIQRRHLQPA